MRNAKLINAIIHKFPVLMEDEIGLLARKSTIKNEWLNRKMSERAFEGIRLVDKSTQIMILITMLKQKDSPIKLEDYKMEGDNLVFIGKKEATLQEQYEFSIKTKKIIKSVLGNMDQEERMMAKNSIAGALVMLFRTWMPTIFKERFGATEYDYDLDRETRGRYISLFRILIKHFAIPLLKLITFRAGAMEEFSLLGLTNKEKVDEIDRINMKSNLMELAIIFAIAALLMGGGGGDKDKRKPIINGYLGYILNRLSSEILFFAPFYSIPHVMKNITPILLSPIPSTKMLQDIFNLLDPKKYPDNIIKITPGVKRIPKAIDLFF